MWKSLFLMKNPMEIADQRFFLELEPGGGFIFQSKIPFKIEELEEEVNQKIEERGDEYLVVITRNALEEGKFDVRCFHSLINKF